MPLMGEIRVFSGGAKLKIVNVSSCTYKHYDKSLENQVAEHNSPFFVLNTTNSKT